MTDNRPPERLASVLYDWWWDQPIAEDELPLLAEDAAMDDMRSLVAHLAKHGFEIVEVRGGSPDDR